jgi:hypothetical protein
MATAPRFLVDAIGPTVNLGAAKSGGPVVVDGMVYVGSGSGIYGGMPGNVLLAYSVDGL